MHWLRGEFTLLLKWMISCDRFSSDAKSNLDCYTTAPNAHLSVFVDCSLLKKVRNETLLGHVFLMMENAFKKGACMLPSLVQSMDHCGVANFVQQISFWLGGNCLQSF